jgi:hypothetical protein
LSDCGDGDIVDGVGGDDCNGDAYDDDVDDGTDGVYDVVSIRIVIHFVVERL